MLTELLQEAGFIHTFDQLEGQLRSATIAQLADILQSKYNINLTTKIDDEMSPLGVGHIHVDHNKQHGSFNMSIEFGRHVSDTTNISSVRGLISKLRHELMHVQHMDKAPQDGKDYATSGDDTPEQDVSHMYHYMERAPQALDLCTALAGTNSNPDEFSSIVKHAVSKIDPDHDHSDEIDSICRHAIVKIHGHEKIHNHVDDIEYHLDVVHHHLTTMVMAKVLVNTMPKGDDKNRLKNLINSFTKQVRTKFPEARAYFHKHAASRTKAFKTNHKRIEELSHVEDKFQDALANIMGKKRKAI